MTIADDHDAFLFDLDGVLYRGDRPVPAAADAVARLRRAGKRLAFVTNNSSRTPESVAARLGSVGIPAGADEVETSAMATAELLGDRAVHTAFVVGEDGVRRALADAGITLVAAEDAVPDVVVVGWDHAADYSKLAAASLFVQRGAKLVATNADASYPAPEGLLPGAGALLAAIATTTGAIAEVVGKPHAPLLRAALARAGGGRPLVIGDRIDTDVEGANALGWHSLLVLTGVTTRADLEASSARPTYVGEDLLTLF
ncbi:MAG TPA: HAD-IIA family hydrolase [Actinomycetota bacterium]|jgi:HAD superfamily hydrolase (TIGR01457 family)|nr:HAD-IIA family hydrolase [Actinomycetota bacterium]